MEGKVLKSSHLRSSGNKRKIPVAPDTGTNSRNEEAGEGLEGEPELDLVKNDEGTVTHMHVKCPCGRELTVECDYSTEE